MEKNNLKQKSSRNIMNLGIALCVIFLAAKILIPGFNLIPSAMASTAFMDMVNSRGTTNPTTVELSPGSYSIDGDFTIPANVTLHFEEGAVVSIPASTNLSVDGNIDDTAHQIFDDQNSDLTKGVKFHSGSFVAIRPEWWGAKADDNSSSASQNSNAIEKAVNAAQSAGSEKTLFSIGKYYISRSIMLPKKVSLEGQGDTHSYDNTTVIRLKDGSNVSMVATAESGASTYHTTGDITNIRFHGGSQSAIVNGIDFNNIIINLMRVKSCGFTNFNGYAVNMKVAGRTMIEDNWVSDSQNGMYLQSYDGWIRDNTINFTGDYGFRLIGFDTPFQGNKISGGSSGATCLSFNGGSAFANFLGNEMKSCDYGITDLPTGSIGAQISQNVIINNRKSGIYSQRTIIGSQISENNISNNGEYGIYISGSAKDNKIFDNDLSENSLGALYYSNSSNTCSFEPQSCGEYSYIENNINIDKSVSDYPTIASSGIPAVTISKYWKTENTSPISISNFGRSPRGKEFFLKLGDSNTTLKFSANESADLVTGGDFSSSGNWTYGQSWSWSDGDRAAKHVKGDNSTGLFPLEKNIGAQLNALYEVTFTVKNYTSGSVTPVIASNWGSGGLADRSSISKSGTFTRIVKADNAATLKIYPSYDFVGEIDDVAVKKIDTALRGFGGVDKKFNEGDQIRCLKGPDTYWYCDQTTGEAILEGDLNSDSHVNKLDLDILKVDFLKITASLTNPISDIDGDGQATIKDVGILMSGWKP
jgi:parallel beta-helix repeat protein